MCSNVDISSVIAGWQEKLLQLDRRNSLLYYRGQRSGVGILETTPDEFLDGLQRGRSGLAFAYAESRRRAGLPGREGEGDVHVVPGDIETDIKPLPLQRRLLSLHRKDREWEEEQGVDVLFVAFGFLNWIDKDGEAAAAPLLLMPAGLHRASPRDPWRLRLEDDDLQVNATLRHQLSRLGVILPDYDQESPSAYLEEVARQASSKEGWSVEPNLALATFPFAKMAMWEDLEQMRRKGVEHPVVCALGGDPEALVSGRGRAPQRIPDEDELAGGRLDDLLPAQRQFTILPADHSQLRAIELARAGEHLVVHGPPGTGKSQTIANIIGTLLADGKRVLFVSEKTAALDVVKNRLEKNDLGCFCLDLHSDRARKSSVYQQIRESLQARRNRTDPFPIDQLEDQRRRLNAVVRALHEKRTPLGMSVFEVHGRFASVRSLPRVEFTPRRIEDLTWETLSRIQEAAARLARRPVEFEAHRTSPWRALRQNRPKVELGDELRRVAVAMRQVTEDLKAAGDQTGRELGVPGPESPKGIELLAKLARHMTACPGVPEAWLKRDTLARLERRAGDLATMQSDRRRLEESLQPFFGRELPPLDFGELEASLALPLQERQRLAEALGPEWEQRIYPRDSRAQDLKAAADRTRGLCQAAGRIAEVLSFKSPLNRLAQIRKTVQQLRAARSIPPVPEPWFEPGGLARVRSEMEKARTELAGLVEAERQVFAAFEEDIVEKVSPEMLVRYRTDHQSLWRIFKKAYRADQRTIRGCLRSPRKLKLEEALSAVQSSLRLRALREEWERNCAAYGSALGALFSGRNTDWEALAAVLASVEAWLEAWEWGPESARSCLSSSGRSAWEPAARELEEALAAWEANPLARGDAGSDLDLPVWRSVLDSGAGVLARLAREGETLWPHLQGPVERWAQLIDLLAWAVQLRKIQTHERELAAALRQDFEGYYDGPDSDWRRVHAALGWTSELLDLLDSRVPSGLVEQCRRPQPAEVYAGREERLLGALAAFRVLAVEAAKTFEVQPWGWADWESPSFERLVLTLAWIEEHADNAAFWLEYRQVVQDLEALLAPAAVDALRGVTEDASQVPGVVLRRVYASWLDCMRDQDARLQFQPRDHEALRREFRKLDEGLLKANRARIREQCFRAYPDSGGTAIEWGQMGILNRQLSLKRRQLSVRRLIQEIPKLLQSLKPCFLMSPVAVSQYLPHGELATDRVEFDAVVFDEASQVYPQDAVPAIARAKQVIVVGDEKQLPPTSFFRSEALDDDEGDEDEPGEDRLAGVESILDVMVGLVGTGVLEEYLGIHYRSRHESLIGYSNHYFYDDRLLTFPSPDTAIGPLGLTDVYLPQGRYDAGATRTNRAEAELVVRRVFDLLRSRPLEESVGVVTLSRAQADLIEELVSESRLQDTSLDSRFAEDVPERFFIKNLENVQGDERDHILLSIGYGPTVGSGGVPNRFGPINQDGGERRLNVAVTRARRSLTLIRSLRPEQIISDKKGARLLRRFFEYAQDPVRAFEQTIDVNLDAETESPFEEAVYRALTERGYRVAKQVGCFGYRIDLAITSEDGSRYELGIECDGAAYHRAPAARDRDWLRQEILEGLGWTIHRIWSTDWIRDPAAEIRSVEKALEAARSKPKEISVREEAAPRADLIAEQGSLHLTAQDLAPPGPAAREFRFAPYREAELPRNERRVSIQNERLVKLGQLVTTVVEAEGPVHREALEDRLCGYYGLVRVSRPIQLIISQGVSREISEGRIRWLTPEPGSPPCFLDAVQRPRRPEPRGASEAGEARDIERIWPGEIESGVLRVVDAGFGVPREEAIVAVARAFGYERVGSKIREALESAIENLLASREILETAAGLTRPEAPVDAR